MKENVRQALLEVEQILMQDIGSRFIPEARITLLVRIPGNSDATVMLTTDVGAEVIEAVRKQFAMPDMQEAVRG